MASFSVNDAEAARARLMALEERIPWNAVKKIWATKRQEWVNQVQSTLSCFKLGEHLHTLESMLRSEAMVPSWALAKLQWRAGASAIASPAQLEDAVNALEQGIQWQRILVTPDGRPLTAEEIASGQYGVGGAPSVMLPPPLSAESPADPPEGVPRSAARMLLLLHSMGARNYDPKVVVQLLDVMHGWTAATLLDASANARMRLLSSSRGTHAQPRSLTQLTAQ